MRKLEELELQLENNSKERHELQNEIDDIKLRRSKPELINKYENKFWKYENNYGMDSDERWYLYSYCIEVEDGRGGLFNSFESSPRENKFKVSTHQYYHLCQIKISQEEYYKAFDEFKKRLDLIK